MKNLKHILRVEDDPKDIELTLAALAEHKLGNRSGGRPGWGRALSAGGRRQSRLPVDDGA
jgi:hypothetical protein